MNCYDTDNLSKKRTNHENQFDDAIRRKDF